MQGLSIVTAAQMRAAEQAVIAAGTAEYALMERAGAAAAEIIWRAGGDRDVLILCGPGNNGGDGYVIARHLQARGVPVRVAAMSESRTPSARLAREAWGGPIEPFSDAKPAAQLVDALFGTGLTRVLDKEAAVRLAALVAGADRSYAIDLPSGVETDSGRLLSDPPAFDVTIALGALKPAHLLQPAAGLMGRVVCVDIGVPVPDTIRQLASPYLAAPGARDHKYSRGLVAVVGGAMPGASRLAARAAANGGAGMVRHIAPDDPVAGPDAIVRSVVHSAADLARHLEDMRIGAALVGPGLGLDDHARAILDNVLRSGRPLVLDADALTLLGQGGMADIPCGAIMTPHEGEFVRMFGDGEGSKIDRAQAAARRLDGVVVYKGADTVIAAPDGRAAIAAPQTSWLSTAGTGDVLAGLCAARLAGSGDPFRAACEAVWLHGDAARRAGPAFVADDLIAYLAKAVGSRL
ncbi:MAG: NAD(P)H-hydrate dehydratase [Sphingobium sp.]